MNFRIDRQDENGLITVRAGEVADARQCLLKHNLGWLRGWTGPPSEAIRLGNAWHLMMQRHFETIKDAQDAGVSPVESEVIAAAMSAHAEADDDLMDRLHWMYEGFIETYELDPQWKILSVEETMTAPILDKNDEPSEFLYTWTSDLFVWDEDFQTYRSIDWKSTGRQLRKMDIDFWDSFGLYTVGWHALGYDVMDTICAQVQTKKLKRHQTLDERYQRIPAYYNETQLRNIRLDALRTMRHMFSDENLEEPYSAPDPQTCDWKCSFSEVHMAMRKMKDPWPKIDHMMRGRGFEQDFVKR